MGRKSGIGQFLIVVLMFTILVGVLLHTKVTNFPSQAIGNQSDENNKSELFPGDGIYAPFTLNPRYKMRIASNSNSSLNDDSEINGIIDDASAWLPIFEPFSVEETSPDLLISSTGIMSLGQQVSEYLFEYPIDFAYGFDYGSIDGITTFRGNNFRDSAAFGFAEIYNGKFGGSWFRTTSNYLSQDETYWSGHGWTGQPLIVNWSLETRSAMNMYDWAKEQESLVEVVYPAMDGYVYFTELETGKQTRENLYLGYTFKGSGAIDPRGYPLLYVGAGFEGASGAPGIFIISLVDGTILHSFGNGDGFAPRAWYAADAAPLIDSETDTLIYPSENGIIYFIKLNSEFDTQSGSLSINPDPPVKWRYNGKRSHVDGKFWLGMEASPVIWRGYLFIADNGGHLLCLDINKLELVWVRDILDDTNCSPVLALEDGQPFIYISTSFHSDWRASADSSAVVPIWKIDARTGETVWQVDYTCRTMTEVSGGVQGTIATGKYNLDNLVFVPMARTPNSYGGILAAIDKYTGQIVWEYSTSYYSWSSPVCFYDQNNKGYIIYCTANGYMYMLDGESGELLDTFFLGGLTEASPAIYNNTIVIGTRDMRIWGITLI
ncbi:MAG: PQQ-binding-like beta-propeller repeat protein [Oscillospiraceae bacterium]|nr:PQQ-binding-like beta-propeller repeat protein [Oscillospiraceae bacterium]